jgi:hypothetical protein
VRESIGTVALRRTAAPAEDRRRASDAATTSTPRREQPPAKPRRTSKFTSADAFDLYKRYRLLSTSENASEAISDLFREFEDKFGLTRKVVRNVVASEKLRKRLAQEERRAAIRDSVLSKRQSSAGAAQSTVKTPHGADDVNTRPRDRITGLPQLVDRMDPAAVAGIVANKIEGNLDQEAIVTCLQQLVPDEQDRYGYLTWRYAAARLSPDTEPRTLSLHEDLVTLAVVLDQEKQRLDGLVRAHGPILEQSRLAKRGMDNEFRELIDNDDIGRSAADELRRTRAAFDFLRRAVVLTIACPEYDGRLWDILERLQPPPVERLVETSPQLERAIRRLTSFINAVERLLATDEANLADFYQNSRAHLNALQERRYDFLRPFRDATTGLGPSPRHATADLAFQILPQGEQLRAFLGDIRASKMYSGYRVDEHRLTVLEDLQNHFGADRCTWHRGHESSDGIDNRYLVLAIRSTNGVGEDAVAISPLAGRHATYIVRHDCAADADWRTLFAHPKFEARLRGARKLLFTTTDSHVDQYRAMRNKIIKLLECHPRVQARLRLGAKARATAERETPQTPQFFAIDDSPRLSRRWARGRDTVDTRRIRHTNRDRRLPFASQRTWRTPERHRHQR